jgi:hypothetical protein
MAMVLAKTLDFNTAGVPELRTHKILIIVNDFSLSRIQCQLQSLVSRQRKRAVYFLELHMRHHVDSKLHHSKEIENGSATLKGRYTSLTT